jgi:hypothetical protein
MRSNPLTFLTSACLAISAVAGLVPNGDFQMYKPGTGHTVLATFADGDSYAAGVGDGIALSAGSVNYSDNTTGTTVDLPGWTTVQGGNDLVGNGVAGSTGMNLFAAWGSDGRIQTTGSLFTVAAGQSVTITAMVGGPDNGPIQGPLAFHLVANGVQLTPTSFVDPTLPNFGAFQMISRTYDASVLAPHIGALTKIVLGVENANNAGERVIFDDVSIAITGTGTGPTPVISEFMADNGGSLKLTDGTEPDWIEIHNPSASPVSLAGWRLTDQADNLSRWTFPAGVQLAPGAYLVVYASGEDRLDAEGNYHTNFALLAAGEFLALVRPDGTIHQEFAPFFPPQKSDFSYGLAPDGESSGYFATATPGATNGSVYQGFVEDATFSHTRGFHEESFQLVVTTATPGATLVYSTDGSTPGSGSAQILAPDPLTPPVLSLDITSTTIVRVLAEKQGFISPKTETHTYLFLDQVIANPAMATSITQNPLWGPQMRDALLEIPTISLVTQQEIPTEPIASPPEIPVSIEMIFPDGKPGFQMEAGVERFGGEYSNYEKSALRVSFKAIYGPKRLKFNLFSDTPYGGDTAVESFDQILLRNGSHDSLFGAQYPHSRGVYFRNRYFFDRQIEMGHLSMRGKFVHVYLNGTYYGHFHLMERPTADFMATHQGGEEEDYDIMKGRSGIFVAQGEATAWNHLVANINNYQIVQDYMDIDNYIDYMLLNFYGGNDHDWYPHHNWIAGRKRQPGSKFQFFMWDNDFLIRRGGNSTTGSTANTIDNGGPGDLLSSLLQNPEFKLRMADRAQKHFFNGGVLTTESVQADITELAQRISRTIIPETARWGTTAEVLYTPDSFQTYVNWIVNINAVSRTGVVINQMKAAGIFPNLAAPVFSQHGGITTPGYALQITSNNAAIYYTTDGSDPRLPGGAINPAATLFPGNPPLTLTTTTTVRARCITGNVWSALNEATFLIDPPADSGNLVISEIHYHPSDVQGALAEYVELLNISNLTIRLAGVGFTQGIGFSFGESDTLGPGQRAVLVADPTAFTAAFGSEIPIAGTFTGRLDNSGERLTLSDTEGAIIQTLRFRDVAPWPVEADGDGYSMVLVAPATAPDHEMPENWRASVGFGGSPGDSDTIPFTGNAATDLLSYALGDPNSVAFQIVNGVPIFEFLRTLGTDDVTVKVELSSDLETWHAGQAILQSQFRQPGNQSLMRWEIPTDEGDRIFVRISVAMDD